MRNMTLGEKIMLLRKQKGWSQEELADKMDISRQSVSKWESDASIPELDKIVKISDLFAVSTDYLLKEETEEECYGGEDGDSNRNNCYQKENASDSEVRKAARNVSLEEAEAFMELSRRLSVKSALSISLYIVSSVALFFLYALWEYKKIAISENAAEGAGILLLLVVVSIATAMRIATDEKLKKYKFLEEEKISLGFGVREIVEKRKQAYERAYRTAQIAGVVLCIMSAACMLLTYMLELDGFYQMCSLPMLLIVIAVAVFLMHQSGMIDESYDKLLQTGGYTLQKKEERKWRTAVYACYWLIVTAVFFGYGMVTAQWGNTGILWIVSGLLFAALVLILNAVSAAKKRKRTG